MKLMSNGKVDKLKLNNDEEKKGQLVGKGR